VKRSPQDIVLAAWTLIAGGLFVLPVVFGLNRAELERAGRYVYLIVMAVGTMALALGALEGRRRL